MIQLLKKQGEQATQLVLKNALQAWKTFKDTMLNDEIQDELQAIAKAQRSILVNIQKSFADKRNMRTRTRFFNAYLELYGQRKNVQVRKT
jgi:hypothetical protein